MILILLIPPSLSLSLSLTHTHTHTQVIVLEFAVACWREQERVGECVRKGIFTQKEVAENSLRMDIPDGALTALYERLLILHILAKKVISGESVTLCDAFRLIHPVVYWYYERILSRVCGDPTAAFAFVRRFCLPFCVSGCV